MSAKHLTAELTPTPAKLLFAGLIGLGWIVMITHPMQLMIHHHEGMVWVLTDFAKALAMWGIMVLAMMVPTLVPLFKSRGGPALEFKKTSSFFTGYLLAWGGFCVAATMLQYTLRSWALTDMHDYSVSVWLSSTLLIGAGIFQLTNVKQFHLKACQLSLNRFRAADAPGVTYITRGMYYGADCIKCCWPMMLTMFVFGLMNVLAMAGLTAIMIAEKTLRQTSALTKLTGGLFIAAGLSVWFF